MPESKGDRISGAGLISRNHPGCCRWLQLPTLRHLWIGLPVFLLTVKSLLFPLPLLDFWWHLKMGQVILEKGVIPRVDIFSFTAAGKVFVVQNWLAEILFYLFYRAGGFPFLVFSNTVLLVLALIPVYRLCLKAAHPLWPGIVSASLVALCLPCNMRPQLYSFVLFGLFYWIVMSYCSGGRNYLWLLPVLMIFWVNLHGAFVLGLALIAIAVIGESVRSFTNADRSSLTRKQLANMVLIFIFCLLATLANPEFYKVFGYIRTVVNDPSSRQFVLEWQPPAVGSAQGITQFYLPFFLTTIVLIVGDRRPNITELMLYGGFSVFAMTATRNAVWFLFIAAPILARCLNSVSLCILPRPSGTILDAPPPPTRKKTQSSVLNLALVVAALTVAVIQSPWIQQRYYKNSLLDANTPVGAMDYISGHAVKGHIFHPQIYGDYLIWRLWPNQHSFFDGRVHLFGEPFVNSYRKAFTDSHWEDILNTFDIRYLLLSKSEIRLEDRRMIESARSSRNWRCLYEDDKSVLFKKLSHDK